MKTTCSVLLVDDHAIWRGGVRAMLKGSEFVVVGEASDGKEAVEIAGQLRPQIALVDIRMSGGDGLAALAALKEQDPLLMVLMLTTYDNPTFVARAVAGGAAGYLTKTITHQELLAALRAVVAGEVLLRPEELLRLLRHVGPRTARLDDLIEPLSPREEEVLRLVAEGLSNREIARLLFIGEGTVRIHVEHIRKKLGVSDRTQTAVWAMRHGFLTPPETPGEI